MTKGPEATEQGKVTKYLKKIQLPFVKMTGYGKQGWPDITMCIGGRLVGIEMKAAGKKPDEQQMVRRREIMGQHGVWLCYDNHKDAIKAIKGLIQMSWLDEIDYSLLPESIQGKEPVNVNL